MVKLKGDKEIGGKKVRSINTFAHENAFDFLSMPRTSVMIFEAGREKICGIVSGRYIWGLDFIKQGRGRRSLGDAYEYLMKNCHGIGKSKGQFYTPAEVSRIMAKVIGIEEAKGLSE